MGYRTNLTTSPSALAAADAASGRSWCYAYDGNGNVSAVVDLADGTKVGRYEYDAFGRTIASWGDEGLAEVNQYRFSTKPVEGTGLCYYGYRWYGPENGRWLGRDPIGERGGVNLCGFVDNKTVNSTDRLGLCTSNPHFRAPACEAVSFYLELSQALTPPSASISDDGKWNWRTGRTYIGSLCVHCSSGERWCWEMQSGGYRHIDSKVIGPSANSETGVPGGDDSSVPEGDYRLSTSPSGDTNGYLISPFAYRDLIKIHHAKYAGSHGCVTTKCGNWTPSDPGPSPGREPKG